MGKKEEKAKRKLFFDGEIDKVLCSKRLLCAGAQQCGGGDVDKQKYDDNDDDE